MPAYIIADVTVTNEEQMVEYRRWSSKAMQEFGAEVVVRGGAMDILEGNWSPQRVVVLRFRDRAHAKSYYDSVTYAHARSLRAGAGTINMIVVDGVD